MTERGTTDRRRLLRAAGSLGVAATGGCLRLTSRDATRDSDSTTDPADDASTGTQSGGQSDAGEPTAATAEATTAERDGSVPSVAYDFESETQLADWDVTSTGDAFTRVADGALHQRVTNCEDTAAELSLGAVDGPFVVEIDWRVEWASTWGERANLYVTVDGVDYYPEESKKDPGGTDWFSLVWHHRSDGGDANRGGNYVLHYPKRTDDDFGGEATLTIATERSDNCSAGDHSRTDLYVESLAVHP